MHHAYRSRLPLICAFALFACTSSSKDASDGGRDGSSAAADSGKSASDSGLAMDGGKVTGAPGKKVSYTVPKAGGSVRVVGKTGMIVDFEFPKTASGKAIVLTPVAASDIGWPTTQFAEVIKLEPDGSTFKDPIVVRPSTQDVIVLDFHSVAQKSGGDGLPLNASGDGVLLSHFSTLAVVPTQSSCGKTSGWVIGSAAQGSAKCKNPAFPRYISYSCSDTPYCVSIDADCCAPASATACQLGDVPLSLSYSPAAAGGSYPYCDQADSGVVCVPDVESVCQCQPNGAIGSRTCMADGRGYTSCVCGVDAGTDSGSNEAGAGDSGLLGDAASGSDASSTPDGSTTTDAGMAATDAGMAPDAGSGVSCNQALGTLTSMTVPNAVRLNSVAAYGSTDTFVVAVGANGNSQAVASVYNGQVWTTTVLPGMGELYAVRCVGTGSAIAVGKGGAIYQYLNSTWTALTNPTSKDLRGLWMQSSNQYLVSGANGAMFYYDGTAQQPAWVDESNAGGPTNSVGTLRGLWGRSPSNVWAVNDTGETSGTTYAVQHWNGSAWSPEASTNGADYRTAIWASTSTDIWAVGYSKGTSAHYNGTAWTASNAPGAGGGGYLESVWGSNSNAVWAVGDSGQIDYWNGTHWTACTQSVSSANFNGVAGSYSKLWIATGGGTVLHN